jgi:hypothetical protein
MPNPEDRLALRDGLITVTASTRRPGPCVLDPRIKSLNYLNNILAKLEARVASADEALLLNEQGHVAEGTAENIFIAMTLDTLGVPYRLIACRPMSYQTLRPRTHMALIVQIENESWLCDLGFSSYGIRAPVCLADIGKSF